MCGNISRAVELITLVPKLTCVVERPLSPHLGATVASEHEKLRHTLPVVVTLKNAPRYDGYTIHEWPRKNTTKTSPRQQQSLRALLLATDVSAWKLNLPLPHPPTVTLDQKCPQEAIPRSMCWVSTSALLLWTWIHPIRAVSSTKSEET